MLRSRSRDFEILESRESESEILENRSRKFWKGRSPSWSWIFYPQLRNPGFYTIKKMPKVRETVTEITFRWRINAFFHNTVKLRDLPLSAVTILLHCLPNMSGFNGHMRQNAFRSFKWTFYEHCHVIFAQKDEQWNSLLARFATCLFRQRRGREWTASSSPRDFTTVNLQ